MNNGRFRHELKYVCTTAELENLKARFKDIISIDEHANQDGEYLIRSIYFDDYDNSKLEQNDMGVDSREKWRIRCYNGDKSTLKLELKRKENGMIQKLDCPISVDLYEHIMSGALLMPNAEEYTLLNKFAIERMTNGLKPNILVEYRRIPYVFKSANIRITFDLDIASSHDFDGLFLTDIVRRPVMRKGLQLLEVKYNEYLPDYIYHAIQMTNMRQVTFSKYFLCRKYNTKGIESL